MDSHGAAKDATLGEIHTRTRRKSLAQKNKTCTNRPCEVVVAVSPLTVQKEEQP
jgi:hypothetical protein